MIETCPEDFYTSDSLIAIRNHNGWYREMLDEENGLITSMYESSDIEEVRDLFQEFLPLRERRLDMVKEKIGIDFKNDLYGKYPTLTELIGSKLNVGSDG